MPFQETRSCWYISESQRESHTQENDEYCRDYITSDYFFIKKNSSNVIEGYLGRSDRNQDYFFTMEPGITYFDDYQKGRTIYFSFDRFTLYQVVSILPENYLLFILRRVVPESLPKTSEEDNEAYKREIMLLDFMEENPEYKQYVADFKKRQTIAGHFLSGEEFIDNEIKTFQANIKEPMLGIVQVNNMPPVQPYNVSSYSFKTYEYVRKGHNLQIKQLIESSRKECENAKTEQLKRFGALFAYAPCEGESFDQQVRFAIRRGVGFALYIKYLKDQLPIQPHLDSPARSKPFDSIFQSPQIADICKDLLDELGVDQNLTKGKAGLLAAAIVAIKTSPGILNRDSLTDLELLNHFNSFLNTKFKSVPKRSKQYEDALDDAKRYLKLRLKK